jgi:hypothetical protein
MSNAPRSAATEFELCPAGPQQLVCSDYIDLGMENTAFRNQPVKMMHKVRLRFETAARNSKGKPYIVQRRFTWSMHPKSGLRKFLEQWIGRALTDHEASTFDFEAIIGWNGLTTITHNTKVNGTFADVGPMMGLWPGMQPISVDPEYVRAIHQPPPAAAPAPAPAAPPMPPGYPPPGYPPQQPQAPAGPQPPAYAPPLGYGPPPQGGPQPGYPPHGYPPQPMAPAPAPQPAGPPQHGAPTYAPYTQPPAAPAPPAPGQWPQTAPPAPAAPQPTWPTTPPKDEDLPF